MLPLLLLLLLLLTARHLTTWHTGFGDSKTSLLQAHTNRCQAQP